MTSLNYFLLFFTDDPCSPDPCLNSGTCSADSNSLGFKCSCSSGYIGLNCGIQEGDTNFSIPSLGSYVITTATSRMRLIKTKLYVTKESRDHSKVI